jgi:hypothetical protein
MSAEDINDLTMRIEDEEGGNIDFSEGNLNENSIPSGWTETKDLEGRGFDPDEPDDEHILKIWSAPMEGWDEEHKDEIIIKKGEDGKYYQDAYVSYGDYEEQGPFETYEEALKSAIGEMNAFKEDWDSEGDYMGENKMDNFDLTKYLAEGRLLKEEIMLDTTIMVDPHNFYLKNSDVSDEEKDYVRDYQEYLKLQK